MTKITYTSGIEALNAAKALSNEGVVYVDRLLDGTFQIRNVGSHREETFAQFFFGKKIK